MRCVIRGLHYSSTFTYCVNNIFIMQEVVERFENQKETTQHLEELKKDNEKQITRLKEDKEKLQQEFEVMKYSGDAKLSRLVRTK